MLKPWATGRRLIGRDRTDRVQELVDVQHLPVAIVVAGGAAHEVVDERRRDHHARGDLVQLGAVGVDPVAGRHVLLALEAHAGLEALDRSELDEALDVEGGAVQVVLGEALGALDLDLVGRVGGAVVVERRRVAGAAPGPGLAGGDRVLRRGAGRVLEGADVIQAGGQRAGDAVAARAGVGGDVDLGLDRGVVARRQGQAPAKRQSSLLQSILPIRPSDF
jgi:hypothetical protein